MSKINNRTEIKHKSPYSKYHKTQEYEIIKKAVNDLINNQDIELKTTQENVIGYLTQELSKKQIRNKEKQK